MWAFRSHFTRAMLGATRGRLPRPFLVRNQPAVLSTALARSFTVMRNQSPTIQREVEESRVAAEEQKHNPQAQLIYYEALARSRNYRAIIQRFDSGQYAVNDQIIKTYIVACSHTGMFHKLDGINLGGLNAGPMPQANHANIASGYNIGAPDYGMPHVAQPNAGNTTGSRERPMYVKVEPPSNKSQFFSGAMSAVGFVLVGFLFFAGMNYFTEGKLPTGRKPQNEVNPVNVGQVSFDDVKGAKEAKSELQEIVQFLREPEKFTRLGGELPRGVLLMGPPGTGKTLLAKAVAGEAGVPFFSASGSEFEEMYVGVGARRVRDLFNAAKEKAPCLIFIDEVDAIGGSRKAKEQHSMRLTLNQLLVELDGFNTNSGVIVLAATNFPEMLDKALTRAGRFDRHITVPLPDVRGRTEILNLYADKLPLSKDVDCSVLARGTPGYSGADLSTMVNDAAIHASMRGSETVAHSDFEYAKDKMFMGPERKSAFLTPESRKLTAYHEGGHAIVAINTDGAHPVHKATIMPRGNALGMVFQLPKGDQTSVSRKQLIAEIDVCLGGRAAEEMVFGVDNVTTGASSDMRRATQIARNMVTKYGMSDKVGLIDFDQLGDGNMSASTKAVVDAEIKALLDNSYNRVTKILSDNRPRLDNLASALITYETLTGDEVKHAAMGKLRKEI